LENETCLGRVLRFSFLSHNRYNFSPASGGRAFIHFEENARKGTEGLVLREAAAEEGEEHQQYEEGIQETLFKCQRIE